MLKSRGKEFTIMVNVILILLCAWIHAVSCEWVKEMENNPMSFQIRNNSLINYGYEKVDHDPNLFQGDIVLSPWDHVGNGSIMFTSLRHGRWPRGIVPYVITGSIGARGRRAIKRAISRYHKYTCIKFRKKRRKDKSYVRFYRGAGCSSPVGYYRGRVNSISLAPGCWHTGIVMHEIAHTLGIFHEQSRPDRDKYIRIIWRNIPKNMRFNFEKRKRGEVTSYGTPYDYSSMMHYGPRAFGIGGRITIKTKRRSKQKLLGNRKGFSRIDKIQIRKMYRRSCRKRRRRSRRTRTRSRRVSKSSRRVTRRRKVLKKVSSCRNKNQYCSAWAKQGQCSHPKFKKFMKRDCCQACRSRYSTDSCVNNVPYCDAWAKEKHCTSVKWGAYMKKHCCQACQGHN